MTHLKISLVTLLTTEWFFSSMDSHVLFKMTLSRKYLITLVAMKGIIILEWVLVSVDSKVLHKINFREIPCYIVHIDLASLHHGFYDV